MDTLRFALLFTLACAASAAQAIEYRSAAEPSILYDSPSEKGRRMYILAEGTPVEVVVTLDKWVKVRDPNGSISWIEEARLSDKRTVLVKKRSMVRQQPALNAATTFEADENLVLEVEANPADGWVKVRHTDGSSGYIRASEVWGL